MQRPPSSSPLQPCPRITTKRRSLQMDRGFELDWRIMHINRPERGGHRRLGSGRTMESVITLLQEEVRNRLARATAIPPGECVTPRSMPEKARGLKIPVVSGQRNLTSKPTAAQERPGDTVFPPALMLTIVLRR